MAIYYNYSNDEDDHEEYDEDALPERDEAKAPTDPGHEACLHAHGV